MPGDFQHAVTPDTGRDWALVLAAGEGSRLRRLTTTASGVAVPKQFCSLSGGTSLLHDTLRRAQVIAPAERTCVVVCADHRCWWQSLSRSIPSSNIVVQPCNRGTAIGILLPLLAILQRDPDATLGVLPSDHFVRNESLLADAMRQAMRRAHSTAALILLGLTPEEPDPELGYVVPGPHADPGMREVEEFVEKPDAALAADIVRRGGLWNSFIFAVRGRSLLDMFEQRVPEVVMEMTAVMQRANRDSAHRYAQLAALYERLPTVDFSRDIVQRQPRDLRVVSVSACGWSDLGTPGRVADVLRKERLAAPTASLARHSTGFLDLATQHLRLHVA